MKIKKVIHNCKTGKEEIIEEDITLPTYSYNVEGVDFKKLNKLVKYAELQGWLK